MDAILVVNAGSSSVKFQIFGIEGDAPRRLIKGQIDAQTMPKIFGGMPDDDLWKIVAYVRSIYAGDKSKVAW